MAKLSRRPLVRLLTWGLIAAALTGLYAALGIFFLRGTSPWMDVAFGVALILLLLRQTARPDLWPAGGWEERIGWGFALVAALTAAVWLSPEWAADLPERFPWGLPGGLHRLLIVVVSEPALGLSQARQTGHPLPLDSLLRLGLACLALGMVALATAGSLRAVGRSLQPVLSPAWDGVQVALMRVPVRPGRWLARLRWGLSALLIGCALVAGVTGWAAVANTQVARVNWQTSTIGPDVRGVVWDDREGVLYAVTMEGGVFRSGNGGVRWEPADADLTGVAMRALALDARDRALYGAAAEGLFRSADGGASWQVVLPVSTTHSLWDPLSTRYGYGVVLQDLTSQAPLVWAVYGGGSFWAPLAADLGLHQAAIRPRLEGEELGPTPAVSPLAGGTRPGPGTEVIAAWGQALAWADLGPRVRRVPLAWLAVRAWIWRSEVSWSLWLALPPLAALGLALALTYANLARPFGVPLWATLLARRRLDSYARPTALEAAWSDWEQAIRAELLRYGDVTAVDLFQIPGPFRRYALRRYAQTHSATQALESHPTRLRLLTGDRLRRWWAAWDTASRSVGSRAGTAASYERAVDGLAAVLADGLGLTCERVHELGGVRAGLVEAPALRLKLPPRFPLAFVADPRPGPGTVEELMDAVDELGESGTFALVVPLEPPVRRLDVAAELRQALDRSPHLHDFIVLGRDDVLDILIARDPTAALVQRILAQVDLMVVSPFVISGPVPERVFFGREAEVRMLVESAGSADFAIVGNRKIGKTSLLQRVQGRLAAGRRVRPLTVDCQIVRDADGFFAAFQAQNRLTLPALTAEGFMASLVEVRRDGGIPVLLLDEVDELLASDRAQGEPLSATWRALAQVGECRFIFCGSTELARRLDDPSSAFFNFPQPLSLGYLAPETTRSVLAQPMETLGLVLEEAERLLDEVQTLTSGHPNLIQYVGRGLVEAANRRGERRVLLEDLVALRTSVDFTEYYLKTVWGQAGPLERLITLVVPAGGFRLEDLERTLAALDVEVSTEALDQALKLLRVYAILEKRERTYGFVPHSFPEILHQTQEVERLIGIERRRLARGGS
ncbi:MAG TPA: hypothetical protein ENN99_12105 [Chloroflexi bacterium]|nr:hypothetical protein [Chloroflexota bacterium]